MPSLWFDDDYLGATIFNSKFDPISMVKFCFPYAALMFSRIEMNRWLTYCRAVFASASLEFESRTVHYLTQKKNKKREIH